MGGAQTVADAASFARKRNSKRGPELPRVSMAGRRLIGGRTPAIRVPPATPFQRRLQPSRPLLSTTAPFSRRFSSRRPARPLWSAWQGQRRGVRSRSSCPAPAPRSSTAYPHVPHPPPCPSPPAIALPARRRHLGTLPAPPNPPPFPPPPASPTPPPFLSASTVPVTTPPPPISPSFLVLPAPVSLPLAPPPSLPPTTPPPPSPPPPWPTPQQRRRRPPPTRCCCASFPTFSTARALARGPSCPSLRACSSATVRDGVAGILGGCRLGGGGTLHGGYG